MATENRDWGSTRIQGALATSITEFREARSPPSSANTVWSPRLSAWRRRHGPSSWRVHWDVLAAADFFTVDIWTRRGLTRVGVLFIIELSTRRIQIAGITSEPHAVWMGQMSQGLGNHLIAPIATQTLRLPHWVSWATRWIVEVLLSSRGVTAADVAHRISVAITISAIQRVRPRTIVDAAAGYDVQAAGRRTWNLQLQVTNLTARTA
jgi:hypothetical protein